MCHIRSAFDFNVVDFDISTDDARNADTVNLDIESNDADNDKVVGLNVTADDTDVLNVAAGGANNNGRAYLDVLTNQPRQILSLPYSFSI